MKRSSLVCLILLSFFTSILIGQEDLSKEDKQGLLFLPYVSYGTDVPLLDMKDRFGSDIAMQGGIDMVWPNNYSVGIEGNYMFGDNVIEDVLSSLRQENGNILSQKGTYANVLLKERVLYLGGKVGKVFPLNWYKNNIALKVDIGLGYMSHYILLRNDNEDIPQIKGDLVKGYDRSTNGVAINQSIGLHYISKKNWRVFLSIESTQGFTKPVRALQYDKIQRVTESRIDALLGVHLGFVMPFSLGDKGEEIYY